MPFSTLPPAPLIGQKLCPPSSAGVGLGMAHLPPGRSCWPLRALQAWELKERKDGRREGRQIFLFFLDRVAKQRDKALWGKAEPHCV